MGFVNRGSLKPPLSVPDSPMLIRSPTYVKKKIPVNPPHRDPTWGGTGMRQ